jgi:hypothetical protein
MTDTALPPWKSHWLNTAVTVKNYGRDAVLRDAQGKFHAELCGRTIFDPIFYHGPFNTAAECEPCINSNCECWKKRKART